MNMITEDSNTWQYRDC